MRGKITALVAGTLVAGGATGALSGGPSPRAAPTPAAFRCPPRPRVLPPDAVARAATDALREVPRLYPGQGAATVTRSDRAPSAGARGSEVKQQCGSRTFNRTVAVELLFPKELPSASLSQGVVFVSRVPAGYRVWEVAH